ncbi:precorrin-6A synthase (deacetylating) [Thermobifida halotolerans]|uniref:Precorrin-6A synthase (Deacetylating) n=1 Tax=Thermobifida halotolerans TaxID=483545 RepID=A0A399FYW6_9ACTN|nr:precorrin-6A synthase (deacetylating) [Thermobifida halotolerans]UOE19387.1 precorrin-6A synthase (deacetylating) [Thermobifida halotolerans]
MTRRALLIGIGPGGPDQLTVEAVRALNEVDVFLVADKEAEAGRAGTGDLVALREEICRRHITGDGYRIVAVPDPPRDRAPKTDRAYGDEVRDWHAARARAYARVLLEQTGPDDTVGFLVWGDPSLYDSTIRVVERVRETGEVDLDYRVVPGVSSVQALAARYRLVLNRIGSPVTVTTGRRLATDVASGADNLVVMLDGNLACADLPGDAWDIWWGANLGTDGEELVAGPLGEVVDTVRAARARVRASRGWVMDIYLLRRRSPT